MGVTGLWSVLESTGKPVTLQSLQGKVLAVDVSIWLHQAVKGFRDKDGNPLKNAHLLGVFFRVCKLLNYGIKPIFVFDGGVPVLKRQTLNVRRSKKLEAQDESEITRRKLLSNLIRAELQKQTKQAIPPSVLIKAGIKELTSSSRRLRSPKKRARQNDDSESADENDLERLQAKLENSDSINSALFAGGVKEVLEKDSSSSDDDDFRGGRNYAEHFSSITNSEFDNLPLEIQHEILFEMQESKKNNSWATVHEMPKDLPSFSSFQMDRLVKRRFLQKKIQSVQKEMGNRHIHVQNLDELLDFENEFDTSAGQTEIIGSKDKGALLIKVKPGSNNANREASSSSIKSKDVKPETEVITIDDFVEDWQSDGESDNEKGRGKEKRSSAEHFKLNDEDMNDEEDVQIARAIELSLQQSKIEAAPEAEKTSSSQKYSPGSISSGETDEYSEADDEFNAKIDEIVEESFQNTQETGQSQESELPSTSKPNKKKELSLHDIKSVLNEAGSMRSTCSKFFDYIGLFDVPDKVSESKPEVVPEVKHDDDNSESSTDDDEFEEVPMEVQDAPQNEPEKSRQQHDVETSAGGVKISITIDQNMKYEKEKDIFSDLFEAPDSVMPSSPAPTLSSTSENSHQYELREEMPEQHTEHSDTESLSVASLVGKDSAPGSSSQLRHEGQSGERMLSMELMQKQERLNREQQKLHHVMGQQDRIATSITEQMNLETQELLTLFGVPYITSPMEAEAQCAFLDTACLTDGTVTDDGDIFLFGGKRVYKNFFSQGEKPVEFYQYSDIVKELSLDREKLILFAMLTGSDYTNGIDGVGPVGALEILAEFPSDEVLAFESLIKFRQWWEEAQHQEHDPENKVRIKLKHLHLKPGFPKKAIYEAYMDPAIDTSMELFRWGSIDKESIKAYTKNKFGWTENKCETNLLPVLKSMESRGKQPTLDKYLTLPPLVTGKQKIKSKRIANAMKKIKSGGGVVDEVALSSPDSSDSEVAAEEPGSSKKRRRVNLGTSSFSKKNAATTAQQPKPKSTKEPAAEAKKVRIPKPVSEIPQRVQEETRRKQNKVRAIEILKNKK